MKSDLSVSEPAELIIKDLEKDYGVHKALRKVDLDVAPGEFLTLLGPSGSGKTTTLNIVSGFIPDYDGSVTLNGSDLWGVSPHHRGIGMVFQNYALFPHMTVEANVRFPLEMRGVSKREATRRAAEALELVGLVNVGQRMPRELSGGQQQRVALSRALVYKPGLLLLDEPLGALDRRLRVTLQRELLEIKKSVGSTIIYVTHDQEEALVLSDRIALYRDGLISQIGSAEALYRRPNSRFVAGFLGEANIFRGAVHRNGTSFHFVTPHWSAAITNPAVTEGAAQLVLRPEHLLLEPFDSSGTASDHTVTGPMLQGVITEMVYFGSHYRCTVVLPDSTPVQVTVGLRFDGLRPGETVRLTWTQDDAVVVPDEAT